MKIKMELKMFFILMLLPLVTSCQYLPDIAKDIESIETDTAIKVEISRETFQKETNLSIIINVQNKDEPITIPAKQEGTYVK